VAAAPPPNHGRMPLRTRAPTPLPCQRPLARPPAHCPPVRPPPAELAIRSCIEKDNAAALDAQLAAELPGTGLTVARIRFLMHYARAELFGSLGALNRLVNNRDAAIK
jgi:hypothetical protein